MRVPVLVRVSECVYAPVRVRAGAGEQLSVSESERERKGARVRERGTSIWLQYHTK